MNILFSVNFICLLTRENTGICQNPEFKSEECEYLVYGRETCPDTNRLHFQGFMVCKTRKRFVSVQKMVPGAHFEKCKGSFDQNFQYCTKSGVYREFGKRPTAIGYTDKFAKAIVQAEKGEFDAIKSESAGLYLRYKATLESLFKCDIKQLNEPCGIWIYGEPGSGKDFCVYKLCGSDLYVKNINKWWDGYKNEKFVLISDVEPCHKENMGYFLKIWCDRYPFLAEVKGSSMRIRPKAIVVTSNYKIEQIWAGNLFVAIWRRFHKIYKIDDKIEVYKREVHKPSDQYVRHLRELINLSENVHLAYRDH